MIEITPLGTGSAIPTRERHLSATVLCRAGRLLLFDCGEGTQFQMNGAGLKLLRVDAVLITHFHGDHLFGLMGVLTTMGLLGRTAPLTLVSPAGLRVLLAAMPGLAEEMLPFALRFVELEPDFEHAVVLDEPEFFVEARPLEHRVFAAGYRFQERERPGKINAARAHALGITEHTHFQALKRGEEVRLADGRVVPPAEVVGPRRPGSSFAYVTDTRPCPGGVQLARDADLLLHEATFEHRLLPRALQTGHSTAREAAGVAAEAGAHRLLLSHFSARHTDAQPLVREAQAVFPRTEAAVELHTYRIAPRPTLVPDAPPA